MDDNPHWGPGDRRQTVQHAVVTILNQIYEEDFLAFRMDFVRGAASIKHWILCRTRS